MSMETVYASLIEAMRGITDFGCVDDTEGRQENMPWDVVGLNEPRPLWVVHLSTSGEAGVDQPGPNKSQKCYEHTFSIKGYYPMNFAARSEMRFVSYLSALARRLGGRLALSACALTKPPRLIDHSYGIYDVGGRKVKCHYAELTFSAQEWITPEEV